MGVSGAVEGGWGRVFSGACSLIFCIREVSLQTMLSCEFGEGTLRRRCATEVWNYPTTERNTTCFTKNNPASVFLYTHEYQYNISPGFHFVAVIKGLNCIELVSSKDRVRAS